MSEVAMGTLYDFNKGILANAESLNIQEAIDKQSENLTNFFTNGQYFMLLCNEQKDYTVLYLTTDKKIENAKEELNICLSNRGELLSFELTSAKDAFEIWLRDLDGEIHVYYLFHYDNAVILC